MNQRELLFAIKFRTSSNIAIKKATTDIKKAAAATKSAEIGAKKAAVSAKIMGRAFTSAGARMRVFAVQARTSFSRLRTEIFRAQTALLALGVAFGLTAVVSQIKKFELAMAKVRAISSKGNVILAKTSSQFILLEATARRLGETTQFTATQVADGLRLLAQAGFTANEAVEAIEGTLNLAIAASTDLGTATTITANAIRAFNLQASEAGRVADVLTAATQNSNTTIELLGEALKFVAPAALAANQSIETTAAAISVLADAGLKGTLAGTGLRRVIVGLLNPVTKAKTAFKALNLDIRDLTPGARDAEGNITSLTTIIQRLADSAFGAREAFAAFGLRGGPAALVLVNIERVKGRFAALNKVIGESEGRAQAFRDTITDTLFGSLKLLNSRIESLALSQGKFAKQIRSVVDFLAQMVASLNGTLIVLTAADRKAVRFADTLKEIGSAIRFLIVHLPQLIAFFIAFKVILALTAAGMAVAAGTMTVMAAFLAPLLVGFGALALVLGGTAWLKWSNDMEAGARAAEEIARATDTWDASLKEAQGTILKIHDALSTEEELASIGLLGLQTKNMQAQLDAAQKRVTDLRDELKLLGEPHASRVVRVNRGRGRQDFGERIPSNIAEIKDKRELIKLAEEDLAIKRKSFIQIKDENKEQEGKSKILAQQRQVIEANGRITIDLTQGLQAAIGNSAADAEKNLRKLNRQLRIAELTAEGTTESLSEAANLKFRESVGFFDSQTIENLERFKVSFAEVAREQLGLAEGLEKQAAAELDPKRRENLLFIANEHRELIKIIHNVGLEQADVAIATERTAKQTSLELSGRIRITDLVNKERKRRVNAEVAFLKFRQNQIKELKDTILLQGLSADALRRIELGTDLVREATAKGLPVQQEWLDTLEAQISTVEEFERATNTMDQGFSDAMDNMIEDAKDFRAQGEQIFDTLFTDLEERIFQFTETGKFNIKEFFELAKEQFVRAGIKQLLGTVLSQFQEKKEDPQAVAAAAIIEQLKEDRGLVIAALAQNITKDAELLEGRLEAINQTLLVLTGGKSTTTSTGTTTVAGGASPILTNALPQLGKALGIPSSVTDILAGVGGGGDAGDVQHAGMPGAGGLSLSEQICECLKDVQDEIALQKDTLSPQLDDIKEAVQSASGAGGGGPLASVSNSGIPAGKNTTGLATILDLTGNLFSQLAMGRDGGISTDLVPRLARGVSRAGNLPPGARATMGLGRNEIPAILHPNEAVIPLTASGMVPIGLDGNIALPNGRSIRTMAGGPLLDMGRRAARTGTRVPVGLASGLGSNATALFRSAQQQSQLFRGSDGITITDKGFITAEGLFLPFKEGGVDLSPLFSGLFGGTYKPKSGAVPTEADPFGFGGGFLSSFISAIPELLGPIFRDIGGTPTGRALAGFGRSVASIGSGANAPQGPSTATTVTGILSGLFGGGGAGAGQSGASISNTAAGGSGASVSAGQGASMIISILSIIDTIIGPKKQKFGPSGRILGFGPTKEGKDQFEDNKDWILQEGRAQRSARIGGRQGVHGGDIVQAGFKAIQTAQLSRAQLNLAHGGIVTGPTNALIGEGGVPEAIVPLPDGRAIPVRLSGAPGAEQAQAVSVVFNITTPDADSFRAAQPQLLAATSDELRKASFRSAQSKGGLG